MSQPKPTIPPGSLVLITGITGFVAAHTAKQLLERGYRVRGTARNLATASWLTEDLFKKYSARGDFELVEVPDIGADKAYDDVVPGVAAIMHVALSDFDADPNKVIPKNVSGINGLLAAALREPSVRAFVFTSSIAASASLVDQSEVRRDSWNDAAVDAAWAPPPYEAARAMVVYMASKVAAEKALWRFVEERHPPFAVNVVSPASILGLPLGSKHANAGPGYPTWMLRRLYEGDTVAASMFPARTFPPPVGLLRRWLTLSSKSSPSMWRTSRYFTWRRRWTPTPSRPVFRFGAGTLRGTTSWPSCAGCGQDASSSTIYRTRHTWARRRIRASRWRCSRSGVVGTIGSLWTSRSGTQS